MYLAPPEAGDWKGGIGDSPVIALYSVLPDRRRILPRKITIKVERPQRSEDVRP
jgi:hypothetical protein